MWIVQQIAAKIQKEQCDAFEQHMQTDAAERAKLRAEQSFGMSMSELIDSYANGTSQTPDTPVLQAPKTPKAKETSNEGPRPKGPIPPPPLAGAGS